MRTPPRFTITLMLAIVALLPSVASAADEACAGISQKCTTDATYDKTIRGTLYSCYDCQQALCKDGGNGGLAGTKTTSVCTEKATTFQPLSLDGQFRGAGDLRLAPKPRPPAIPEVRRRPRNASAHPQAVRVPTAQDANDDGNGNGDDADAEPQDRAPAGDTAHFDEADALFGPRTATPSAGKTAQSRLIGPPPLDIALPPAAPSPIPVPYPRQP